MISLVADASAFGPIILDDEAHGIFPGLIDRFVAGEVVVPVHWRLEVSSLLQTAMKRGRVDETGLARARSLVASTPVVVDSETDARLFTSTWDLAHGHRLTVYDAAYLELAMRFGVPIATLDSALGRAAEVVAVPLFGR